MPLHCQETSAPCVAGQRLHLTTCLNKVVLRFHVRILYCSTKLRSSQMRSMGVNSLPFPPPFCMPLYILEQLYLCLLNVPPLRWLSSFPWRSWEAFWNSIFTDDICYSVCKVELFMPLPFLCCLLESLATFSSESFSGWRSISAAE